MRKLIWKLYDENMISIEVANLLLDKHYELNQANARNGMGFRRYETIQRRIS